MEYNHDLESWCTVCDKLIPSPLDLNLDPTPAPPPPQPALPLSSPGLSNLPSASTSTSSKASSRHAAHSDSAAPRMKRSSSTTGSSGAGNHQAKSAGLKRNKSGARLHHTTHGGAKRNHSHSALHALAPLAPAEGKAKKANGSSSGKGKAKEEVIEVIETDDLSLAAGAYGGPLGMYCSEECRLIDQARNQLQLAHLSGQPFTLSSPILARPASLPQNELSSDPHPAEPFGSLIRRRSSGLSTSSHSSSAASGSFRPSSGLSVLSPIPSAPPTASDPKASTSHASYPFPSLLPPPARTAFAAASLPTDPHSHRGLSPTTTVTSLPVQHAHAPPPPVLNFAARRTSRGGGSLGSYPYRPSLIERGTSSDAVPTLREDTKDPTSLAKEGRSLSMNSLSGKRSGSVDQLVNLAGVSHAREDRATAARPPSALSGFRSMTPISYTLVSTAPNPSTSPVRSRSSLSRTFSQSSHASARSSSGGRSHSRDSLDDSQPRRRFFVGSAPVASGAVPRRRGPSFEQPTLADATALPEHSISPTSRPISLQRSSRSASSASLALMGSSLGRSYDSSAAPRPWAPRRSESIASLSGFLAAGEMASPSSSATPMPTASASSTSTIMAPSPSHRRAPPITRSHSAYSPGSASTYSARSHRPTTTRSGGSSTDLTSGSHPYNPILSTSATSSLAGVRRSNSRGAHKGLVMTHSGSHLPSLVPFEGGAEGRSSFLPPSASSDLAPANAASTNPALSYLKNEDLSSGPPLPPPPLSALSSRTLSYNQLLPLAPVQPPTYTIRDIAQPSLATREGGTGDGAMLPPPVPSWTKRERKKLFYFSDASAG